MPIKTYIALLRGINVVGKNILPMKNLATLFENLGGQNVRTYIQSGNVIFRSKEQNFSRLAGQISAEIKKRHRFEPLVMILEKSDFQRAVAANPYPEAKSEPKSLHLFFMAAAPEKAKLKALESNKKESERFELKRKVLYLHTPEGFGVSKLAGNLERILGVPMTARNWRTVTTIMAMAQDE